jgi:NADPH:quinone reductase
MGRTRNGSYAELVTVPASNVVPVSTSLSWTGLVALTEVYATAWAGLHQSLGLQPRRTVLVRGATLSLGQAAVNVAAEHSAAVIATTRKADRPGLLHDIGATSVLIDDASWPARSAVSVPRWAVSSTLFATACCATRCKSRSCGRMC